MIYVNKNEPEKYKKLADQELNPDEIKIDMLIVGDVKKYAIERKTAKDLVASNQDMRLWEQCDYLNQLKEQGYKPVIIVEEEDLWQIFKFNHVPLSVWYGIFIGIAGFSIPTIRVKNFNDFKLIIEKLKEKSGKETKFITPIFKHKNRTIQEERRDMLREINGIGEVTATKILDKFNSISNIIKAVQEENIELKEILGSKFEHFKEVLG